MTRQSNTLHQLLSFFLIAAISITMISCSGNSANKETNADGQKKAKSEEQSEQDDLTIEEFADAAKEYIQKKTEQQGGHFKVEDEKQGKTLKLTLKKVHRKRLSHLGDNKYFVCADFKGEDGNLYDIDIFMKGTSKDNLEPTKEPMVHKVNGDARFTWYEKDGVWKRRMKDKKKGSEHPDEEHPEDHEHPDEEHPNEEGHEHPDEEHPSSEHPE